MKQSDVFYTCYKHTWEGSKVTTEEVEAIPIEWIKWYMQTGGNEYIVIRTMLDWWEKENEISVMPVSDNSTIPLDYLGERK